MTFGYLSTENHWPQIQIYIYIYICMMFPPLFSALHFTLFSLIASLHTFFTRNFSPRTFHAHCGGVSPPFTHLPISPFPRFPFYWPQLWGAFNHITVTAPPNLFCGPVTAEACLSWLIFHFSAARLFRISFAFAATSLPYFCRVHYFQLPLTFGVPHPQVERATGLGDLFEWVSTE